MLAASWSRMRASLLDSGRNTETMSPICSAVMISRVSLFCWSNSASRARSRASSRLTLKRQLAPRDQPGQVRVGVRAGAQESVAFGVIQDQFKPQYSHVVPDLRWELQEPLP